MGLNPFGRRRRYIVQRKLQERFTSILLLQMTIILLLFAGFSYYWNLQQRNILQPTIGTHDADVIYRNMQGFLIETACLIAISALALIVFGIYASHKIAGPVFKMMHFLNAVKDGNYSHQITFRKGDRLDELAAVLNKAASALETARRVRLEQLALAEEKVGSVKMRLDDPSADQRQSVPDLQEFRVMLGRLAAETRQGASGSNG